MAEYSSVYQLLSKSKRPKDMIVEIEDTPPRVVLSKKHKPKSFFRVCAEPRTFQIDHFFLKSSPNAKKDNVFFIAVEVNSRWAYVEYVPSKAKENWMKCIEKLRNIVIDKCNGAGIWCFMSDDEFTRAGVFKNYCDNVHYIRRIAFNSGKMHQYHGDKLGYVDRAIRTIKWYYTKATHMQLDFGTSMSDKIDNIVEIYNDSPHEGLGMKMSPEMAFESTRTMANNWATCKIENEKKRDEIMKGFRVGDKVHIVLPSTPSDGKMKKKETVMFSNILYEIVEEYDTGFVVKHNKKGVNQETKRYKPYEMIKVNAKHTM